MIYLFILLLLGICSCLAIRFFAEEIDQDEEI